MNMNRKYRMAGHLFEVSGEHLSAAVDHIEGFKPFRVEEGLPSFGFKERDLKDFPGIEDIQYTFEYEDVTGIFGRTTTKGFGLHLKPAQEAPLVLWLNDGEQLAFLAGNWSVRLYRFALWVGYGLMTLRSNTLAIHSSCIVCQNKAILFLGESGTGKSTHTQLWEKYINGSQLLNDDSPIIRIEEGKVWVYGCAWSGKTPCYKNERYELAGCVRLSQAPYNRIEKLTILEAYGAIHPSCAPEFAYDSNLYDYVSSTIGDILKRVPCYHLACLPNKEAALLSYQTLFD